MSQAPEPSGPPPPELELPANFPGLSGDGSGEPYIDHTEVRRIVSALRESLGPLRGQTQPGMSATWTGVGTINQVSYQGRVGQDEAGKWEAAQAFGGNIGIAYDAFGESYTQLLDYVEKWADAVERAIVNYERFHQDSSA